MAFVDIQIKSLFTATNCDLYRMPRFAKLK